MDKEILSTNKAPAAIGPYSQGIAAGSFVFVSGQLPICAATGEMPEDIKAQAEMSLLNVKAVLEAAGSSLDKVVKTTCFLADINDFAAFNEVYACIDAENRRSESFSRRHCCPAQGGES